MKITTIAGINAKSEHIKELQSFMNKLVSHTRKEKGCIAYKLHQDMQDESHFLFYEVWETKALWKKHLKKPHVLDFMKQTETILRTGIINTKNKTMNLSKTLAEKKADSEKNIPAEKWAIMKNSTSALQAQSLSAQAIQKGASLPTFNLSNATGKNVALEDFQSDFLIVTFYRGGWCPYCNMELRAFQAIGSQLEALDTELVAISPETPDNSLSTTEKNELSFEVLSDIDNTYAKSLGLVFQMPKDLRELYHSFGINVDIHNGNTDYELPMPATYVVNKQREIIYSFVPEDYTERLDPELILEVLKKQTI